MREQVAALRDKLKSWRDLTWPYSRSPLTREEEIQYAHARDVNDWVAELDALFLGEPADEEFQSHPFVERASVSVGEQVNGVWCRDCDYHCDHEIHKVGEPLPQKGPDERVHDSEVSSVQMANLSDRERVPESEVSEQSAESQETQGQIGRGEPAESPVVDTLPLPPADLWPKARRELMTNNCLYMQRISCRDAYPTEPDEWCGPCTWTVENTAGSPALRETIHEGACCNYNPYMSRVCELGRGGCTIRHRAGSPVAEPPQQILAK